MAMGLGLGPMIGTVATATDRIEDLRVSAFATAAMIRAFFSPHALQRATGIAPRTVS